MTDEDGFVRVEFRRLGISLLTEGVRHGGPCQRLRAQRPTVVNGPKVELVPVRLQGPANGDWVLDAGWPGVHVVERPLTDDVEVVELAVDDGGASGFCVLLLSVDGWPAVGGADRP